MKFIDFFAGMGGRGAACRGDRVDLREHRRPEPRGRQGAEIDEKIKRHLSKGVE